MKQNLDLDAIANGIVDNNEVGTMFFSILNQEYSPEIASMLCSGIRSFSSKEELIKLLKNADAENMHELVIKSCDNILITLDKMINKLHNKIDNELKERRKNHVTKQS